MFPSWAQTPYGETQLANTNPHQSSGKAWITWQIFYLDQQTNWNQGGPETPGKSSDIL